MDKFTKIVEDKLKEAMDNGEFDNLPGKGKPIDLDEYFKTPPHLRIAYDLLKNAGVLPQEVSLKKEIEVLRRKLHTTTDAQEIARLHKKINLKTVQLNLILERYRQSRNNR